MLSSTVRVDMRCLFLEPGVETSPNWRLAVSIPYLFKTTNFFLLPSSFFLLALRLRTAMTIALTVCAEPVGASLASELGIVKLDWNREAVDPAQLPRRHDSDRWSRKVVIVEHTTARTWWRQRYKIRQPQGVLQAEIIRDDMAWADCMDVACSRSDWNAISMQAFQTSESASRAWSSK